MRCTALEIVRDRPMAFTLIHRLNTLCKICAHTAELGVAKSITSGLLCKKTLCCTINNTLG